MPDIFYWLFSNFLFFSPLFNPISLRLSITKNLLAFFWRCFIILLLLLTLVALHTDTVVCKFSFSLYIIANHHQTPFSGRLFFKWNKIHSFIWKSVEWVSTWREEMVEGVRLFERWKKAKNFNIILIGEI